MSILSAPQPVPASRGGPPTRPPLPPLEAGDHLDQKTFHARYEAMPADFRAELIGGIVYVASPVRLLHGRPYTNAIKWLAIYEEATPGVEALADVTAILGDDSEPQPDALLRLVHGQTTEDDDGYLAGPPEFVVEIAVATESYDLHAKLRDYERHGVKEYLAMIVRTEEAAWFDRGGRRLVRRVPDADGILRSRVFPGLWLDPTALFRGDMRRVRTVLKRGLATTEHRAFAASIRPAAGPRRSARKRKP
jgi:Uma2 family endonuclease